MKELENYNKAIEVSPNHTIVYYNRGNSYGYLKQFESAITDFSKSIQLDP